MMQQGGKTLPLSFDAAHEGEPLLNSAATPWAGVHFELHRTVPTSEPWVGGTPADRHHLRVIVSGSFEVTVRTGGRERTWRVTPGSMSFHHGPGPTVTRIVGSAETVVVEVTQAWLRRLTRDGVDPPRPLYGITAPDETARTLALAMCSEVSRGAPTGPLFAESLSVALLSYAIDHIPVSRLQVSGALSGAQRRKLQRYIEERLTQDLRLTELASLCGLRTRHFTTLFRRAFGMTPHRYVLDRRLSVGAELLVNSGYDIAEVALRTGFSSQSHFTTAFRRAFGVTPGRYASERRGAAVVAHR